MSSTSLTREDIIAQLEQCGFTSIPDDVLEAFMQQLKRIDEEHAKSSEAQIHEAIKAATEVPRSPEKSGPQSFTSKSTSENFNQSPLSKGTSQHEETNDKTSLLQLKKGLSHVGQPFPSSKLVTSDDGPVLRRGANHGSPQKVGGDLSLKASLTANVNPLSTRSSTPSGARIPRREIAPVVATRLPLLNSLQNGSETNDQSTMSVREESLRMTTTTTSLQTYHSIPISNPSSRSSTPKQASPLAISASVHRLSGGFVPPSSTKRSLAMDEEVKKGEASFATANSSFSTMDLRNTETIGRTTDTLRNSHTIQNAHSQSSFQRTLYRPPSVTNSTDRNQLSAPELQSEDEKSHISQDALSEAEASIAAEFTLPFLSKNWRANARKLAQAKSQDEVDNLLYEMYLEDQRSQQEQHMNLNNNSTPDLEGEQDNGGLTKRESIVIDPEIDNGSKEIETYKSPVRTISNTNINDSSDLPMSLSPSRPDEVGEFESPFKKLEMGSFERSNKDSVNEDPTPKSTAFAVLASPSPPRKVAPKRALLNQNATPTRGNIIPPPPPSPDYNSFLKSPDDSFVAGYDEDLNSDDVTRLEHLISKYGEQNETTQARGTQSSAMFPEESSMFGHLRDKLSRIETTVTHRLSQSNASLDLSSLKELVREAVQAELAQIGYKTLIGDPKPSSLSFISPISSRTKTASRSNVSVKRIPTAPSSYHSTQLDSFSTKVQRPSVTRNFALSTSREEAAERRARGEAAKEAAKEEARLASKIRSRSTTLERVSQPPLIPQQVSVPQRVISQHAPHLEAKYLRAVESRHDSLLKQDKSKSLQSIKVPPQTVEKHLRHPPSSSNVPQKRLPKRPSGKALSSKMVQKPSLVLKLKKEDPLTRYLRYKETWKQSFARHLDVSVVNPHEAHSRSVIMNKPMHDQSVAHKDFKNSYSEYLEALDRQYAARHPSVAASLAQVQTRSKMNNHARDSLTKEDSHDRQKDEGRSGEDEEFIDDRRNWKPLLDEEFQDEYDRYDVSLQHAEDEEHWEEEEEDYYDEANYGEYYSSENDESRYNSSYSHSNSLVNARVLPSEEQERNYQTEDNSRRKKTIVTVIPANELDLSVEQLNSLRAEASLVYSTSDRSDSLQYGEEELDQESERLAAEQQAIQKKLSQLFARVARDGLTGKNRELKHFAAKQGGLAK